MIPQSAKVKESQPLAASLSLPGRSLTACRMTDKDIGEVLRFLEERPRQSFVMNGLIRDNGLESGLNRGTFYGCRDNDHKLEGVALLGHGIFLDARSVAATKILASLAQQHHRTHVIMGEEKLVQDFWKYYSPGGQLPRLFCRGLLLEMTSPAEQLQPVLDLRRADNNDLASVMSVHAELALTESGVNPLNVDPEGFRLRCLRRIAQRRVWVWIRNGGVVFKADVISDTPDVCYIEGVYVNPNERGKGYGSRCVSQMSRELLRRTRAVCVLVNEVQRRAQRFFQKAAFIPCGVQQTIFLHEKQDGK
ncbi:MAG TPA: GNAT family N-acetyltransferase [Pyrinomonadaceae bacterium]|nr:GNAT family N-acetyltransferase [Pyrinomonadaceae bacterium]